jgi:methylglutaconyl-CoA hydratase
MGVVEYAWEGAVGHVWLNRPDVRNAFNAEMVQALTDVFAHVPSTLRVLVLGGRGQTFCAGADAASMRAAGAQPWEDNKRDAQALAHMFELLNALPCFVLGAVQGAAMGGGVGLVACCDQVVAEHNTVFALSEVRLGLVPAVISPYVLKKMPYTHARRFFLTGERFDAAHAWHMGLVHTLVTPEEHNAAVQRVVTHVLSAAPSALLQAKRLVREGFEGQTPQHVADTTTSLIATLRSAAEAQEGLQAFLEKRSPGWAP